MNSAKQQQWTAAEARAAFAEAPIVRIEALALGSSLLVVAPHPDDESLGCGGLIALSVRAGHRVRVAVLTDGAGSHPNSRTHPSARLARLRRLELRAAVNLLGGAAVKIDAFGAPDARLEASEAQAQAWLGGLYASELPRAVFVTWPADPHPDHKAAFRIAARQAALWGAELFAYPVWGLTLADGEDAGSAAPCVRLDISSVLDLKADAIAAHRSQTTSLINDDPGGFRLSAADLARHLAPFEVFIKDRLRDVEEHIGGGHAVAAT